VYIAATDPDLNYTKIVQAGPLTLANGTLFVNLPAVKSLPTNQRDFLQKLADELSYQNATSLSVARYMGALEAGSQYYATLQLQAILNYASQRDQAMSQFVNLVSTLPTLPPFSSASVQQVRAYLQKNGLPPVEQQILRGLGLSSSIPDTVAGLTLFNETSLNQFTLLQSEQILQTMLANETSLWSAQATRTIPSSTSAASTTTSGGGKCLIATATYGSELAPEVQLLRSFRDDQIEGTKAGANFMVAFNLWYYSFSPYVASYLNDHWVERTVMKGVLYPLVGILVLAAAVFNATSSFPELAALVSGLLASSLIGAVYLGLPLSLLRSKIRRMRTWRTQKLLENALGLVLLAGLATLLGGEVLASPIMLMFSSAVTVLSTLFLSAAFTSATITRRIENIWV
jgi:hypothetical protein